MSEELEEPRYEVVQAYVDFEVRRYVDTVRAQVQMVSGDRSGGFRRVARYIFGGNQERLAIAMTAPVSMWDEGDGGVLAFTMPAAHSLQTLPAPLDDGVKLVEKPGSVVAVLSFSGRTSSGKVKRLERVLRQAIEREGRQAVGSVTLAIYENPWTTLPFLRRNELHLELERGTSC